MRKRVLKLGSTLAQVLAEERYFIRLAVTPRQNNNIRPRVLAIDPRYQSGRMGIYEKDPIWDDVVPIAQDDGEGALAQIAYTDEYAEGKIAILHSLHKTHDMSSNGIPSRRNGKQRILTSRSRTY